MDSSKKSPIRKELGLQGREARPHYYKNPNTLSHQSTHNWPLSNTLELWDISNLTFERYLAGTTPVPSARSFCFLFFCRWFIWALGSCFSLVRFTASSNHNILDLVNFFYLIPRIIQQAFNDISFLPSLKKVVKIGRVIIPQVKPFIPKFFPKKSLLCITNWNVLMDKFILYPFGLQAADYSINLWKFSSFPLTISTLWVIPPNKSLFTVFSFALVALTSGIVWT